MANVNKEDAKCWPLIHIKQNKLEVVLDEANAGHSSVEGLPFYVNVPEN